MPTTIDRYELRMRVGTEDRGAVGKSMFGSPLRISHRTDYMDSATTNDGWFSHTSISPIALAISSSQPLRRALASQGWILFDFTDAVCEEPKEEWHQDLTLNVTDSLGNAHAIVSPQTRMYYGTIG